jgi:hypothetical protein
MPQIKNISPFLPWPSIDPENGSVGVDVELQDGRTYAFSVATAKNAMSSMNRNNEPFFVSLPPPIIVKRIDQSTLTSTFETLFADDEEAILWRYLRKVN